MLVNIDWEKFIRDRVWFGWYLVAYPAVPSHYVRSKGDPKIVYKWVYSRLWADRLLPVFKRRTASPEWWIRFMNWTGIDD